MEHAINLFRFDTSDHPEPERFCAWREMMAATHAVNLPTDDAPPFAANLALWQLENLLLSHGSFSAQIFTRSEANIRRDHLDHYGVFIQASGHRICRAGDREVTLDAGDALVLDLAQPITSLTTDGSSGTLYLPRELVDPEIPDFRRLHGTVLRDAAANLLARHIYAMGQLLPEASTATMVHLAHATREMALACLVEHAEGHTSIPEQLSQLLRQDIERHIDHHLTDPDLGVASICDALHLSRSALYRLFDTHAGVAGYIKQRRLRRIRAIIAAGVDARPLAEIALDYGFRTGAHFSREFRAEFGHPPGDLRASRAPSSAEPAYTVERAGIDQFFRNLHA